MSYLKIPTYCIKETDKQAAVKRLNYALCFFFSCETGLNNMKWTVQNVSFLLLFHQTFSSSFYRHFFCWEKQKTQFFRVNGKKVHQIDLLQNPTKDKFFRGSHSVFECGKRALDLSHRWRNGSVGLFSGGHYVQSRFDENSSWTHYLQERSLTLCMTSRFPVSPPRPSIPSILHAISTNIWCYSPSREACHFNVLFFPLSISCVNRSLS